MSPLTQGDSHQPTAGTAGQHGIDHPAISIYLPALECECKYSHGATTFLPGGAASLIEANGCREGGEIDWIVPVRGLVAGFVYQIDFELSVQGEREGRLWNSIFSTSTSSYTVRQPLTPLPKSDPLFIQIKVRDMHPGLTRDEALIGKRNVNSAVNALRVHCTDLESGGGGGEQEEEEEEEEEEEPLYSSNGEEAEMQYNFSASAEDVRISFSETVEEVSIEQVEPEDKPEQLKPSHLPDADTAGQHGLDHPGVVIGVPSLECTCDYALSISSDEESDGDETLHERTCISGDAASWVVKVSGLLPGFLYRLQVQWRALADEQLGASNSVISTATSWSGDREPLTIQFRNPLTERGEKGKSTFDLIAYIMNLSLDVAVWDMYPGLTAEEALIGKRQVKNPQMHRVRVHCSGLESGEFADQVNVFIWPPLFMPRSILVGEHALVKVKVSGKSPEHPIFCRKFINITIKLNFQNL